MGLLENLDCTITDSSDLFMHLIVEILDLHFRCEEDYYQQNNRVSILGPTEVACVFWLFIKVVAR